jgi:glycosyltransferase involved in cell wall biosynthesis
MLASFTVLHCISESQRAVVRELATDSSNIHLLPLMPPSISHLSRLRQHHDGQKSQVRFVALNIHGPYKGSEILSEAFAKLEATGAEYELEILGPPPQRFFQSPRVSIGGRYALSDLDAIAGRADYCLLPSVWDETLGFTGMEMLARGVPLIASTWAGASQFVQHGVNGYTFDPDEPDSLLSLLQEICFADGDDVRSPVDWPLPKGLKPYDEHVAEMEGLLQP